VARLGGWVSTRGLRPPSVRPKRKEGGRGGEETRGREHKRVGGEKRGQEKGDGAWGGGEGMLPFQIFLLK